MPPHPDARIGPADAMTAAFAPIPEPTPERPLLSVHVPKAAGTSVRGMLEAAFGLDLALCYQNESCAPELQPVAGRRRLTAGETRATAERCRAAGVRCIHGHFWLNLFYDMFGDTPTIAFVRDPIDRLVSEYRFQVDNADIRHTEWGYKAHTGAFSFEDFMRRAATLETYRKYGLADFFDRIDFIGVVERFDDSIELLRRKAPWLNLPEVAHLNRAATSSAPTLDPDLRAEFETRAAGDMAVYRRARERLDHELALA